MSVYARDRKVTAAASLHYDIGGRIADWLRQRHPTNTAKLSALEMGVAEITAKKWLAGRPPSTAHLSKMLARYGASFAAFVLEPCGQWTAAIRVAADIESLEEHLDNLDLRAARAREDLAALRAEMRG